MSVLPIRVPNDHRRFAASAASVTICPALARRCAMPGQPPVPAPINSASIAPGDQRTPTGRAHAIETLHFEKALGAMVGDARDSGRNAGFSQCLEGEMFGQQEVPPALAHRPFHDFTELHDDVAGAVRCCREGGELGLLAACGGSRHFASGGFPCQPCILGRLAFFFDWAGGGGGEKAFPRNVTQ